MPIFWAGHRKSGFRRHFLESLEAHWGAPLANAYAPADYNAQLARAQVGLSLFGYGFDTVRYWEIPAHGAMLLSEALPLRIPHPFEEGIHAVHFTTTQELLDRVDYYAAHPDEAARIAAAGHAHLLAHHTSKARARQLLGWIRSLGGPC
jgi:spore maturation protein CgeB